MLFHPLWHERDLLVTPSNHASAFALVDLTRQRWSNVACVVVHVTILALRYHDSLGCVAAPELLPHLGTLSSSLPVRYS